MDKHNIEAHINEFKLNKDKFLKYNNIKKKNIMEFNPSSFKLIFKLLPFFLHTNIKDLPGFIKQKTPPCGIYNYEVDENTLNLLEKITKKKIKYKEPSERSIEFISLMGSVGTVAHTGKSDFEIWVGIRTENFTAENYDVLLEKFKLLRKWFIRNKLEVHFFPVDISEAIKNIFGSDKENNCGSAEGIILKDEFFRSSVHITGKIPFWWILSPGLSDTDYADIYQECVLKDASFAHNYIDIGNINNLKRNEFYAAALWQLVKHLKSPFKSYLKMGLIEKCLAADKSKNIKLLSNTLKKNIFNDNLEENSIDSYLLMYKNIEDFLIEKKKADELETLRQCLYLKARPGLSSIKEGDLVKNKKIKIFQEYIKKWKWDEDKLKYLDSFETWPVTEILKFDKKLKDHLLKSFIGFTKSEELRMDNSLINEKDLTILTRKLLSYYGAKPQKIKYFYLSLDDTVYEKNLTITKNHRWSVYRGETTRDKDTVKYSGLLYSANHLTEVCLWIAYNKLYNPFFTKVTIYSQEKFIKHANVVNLLNTILTFFNSPVKEDYNNYLDQPFINKVLITSNFDDTDADDYITVFYSNSWNELYAFHFKDIYSAFHLLSNAIGDYLKHSYYDIEDFIRFFTPQGSMKDVLNIKRFITEILNGLEKYRVIKEVTKIHISKEKNKYIIFTFYENKGAFHIFNNFAEIIKFLAKLKYYNFYTHYTLAENIQETDIVSLIIKTLKRDEIEIINMQLDEQFALFIISDEVNHINYKICRKEDVSSIFINDFHFINGHSKGGAIRLYKITRKHEKFLLEQKKLTDFSKKISKEIYTLNIPMFHISPVSKNLKDFICKIFNTEFNLSEAHDIQTFMTKYMELKNRYIKIYINISEIKVNTSQTPTTSYFLKYKFLLEAEINKIIKKQYHSTAFCK